MLRFEDSLPRLPVPTLEATGARYLRSVRPLLDAAAYGATEQAVAAFVAAGGVGAALQERLLARRADGAVRNWLHGWWNASAYLAVREPVVPYVSYFYSHRDDRRRRDPAARAAALTAAALHFKRLLDRRALEPEYMRKRPLAMSSYDWMFHACRLPVPALDRPVKYSPAEQYPFVVVVRKNRFWKLPYLHNGRPINAAELQAAYTHIYRATTTPAPPVGLLTTQNRDVWAEVGTLLAS